MASIGAFVKLRCFRLSGGHPVFITVPGNPEIWHNGGETAVNFALSETETLNLISDLESVGVTVCMHTPGERDLEGLEDL